MTDTPGNLEQLTPLQKAVLTIKQLRGRLDSLEQAHAEPIAIVGMGCRFPGGVDTPEAFWRLLCEGVDAAGPVPADRWDVEAYYDPDSATPGKIYPRYGYFLPDVDQFDPHFFGLSPREATSATLLDMACNFAVTVCSKRIFGGASRIHKRRLMRYEMTEQTPSVRVGLLELPSATRAFALGEGGSQHHGQADSAQ